MEINTYKLLKDYIKSDAYRYSANTNLLGVLKLYVKTIGFRYCLLMRLCSYLQWKKFLLPLYCIFRIRLNHLSKISGIQIPTSTNIGKGFYIGHFGTIVITGGAVIGKNVNISPCVNIGKANRGKHEGYPTIGNCVYIGPGAKIVGNVKIGNNVAIGAGAVVTSDVPDNACVGGVPARILNMNGATGYVNRCVE